MFDGAVNFIHQRHPHNRAVQPFNGFAPEIIPSVPANQANEKNGKQQRDETPVPLNRPELAVGQRLVRNARRQKKQQRVGQVGDVAKNPDQHRHRNDARQYQREAGKKIRPRLFEKVVFAHCNRRFCCRRPSLLKSNRRDNSFTSLFSWRFITRRGPAFLSSKPWM